MKIAIEGNIGSGKSTVLKRLASETKLPVFEEPVEEWKPLLSLFYKNPKRWSLTFNISVLTTFAKWKNNKFPAIYERTPVSCKHVFTELQRTNGHITPEEADVFNQVYTNIGWLPDIVFYVKTSPEVCFERMKQRGRECENGVSLDYLKKVDENYEKMIKMLEKDCTVTVYVVDGNKDKDVVFQTIRDTLNRYMC